MPDALITYVLIYYQQNTLPYYILINSYDVYNTYHIYDTVPFEKPAAMAC